MPDGIKLKFKILIKLKTVFLVYLGKHNFKLYNCVGFFKSKENIR